MEDNRTIIGEEILDRYNDDEFRQRYRFSKSTVKQLYQEIKDDIEPLILDRRRRLAPFHALLISLRYFASRSWQITSGDLLDCSQPTASRIMAAVTPAIAKLYPKYVQFPFDEVSRRETMDGFFLVANFPGILGAIDCTHIHLRAPGEEDRERFRNRKGRISINVQAVVDSGMKFTNVVARWPGSTHDSRVFDNRRLKERLSLSAKTGWLLGDNGYPCRRYLLTPLLNPQDDKERRYNISHIRTRNIIERTFGSWKRTFHVLSTVMGVKTKTVTAVIIACAVLWNIRRSKIIAGDEEDDSDNEDGLTVGQSIFSRVASGVDIHLTESQTGKDVRSRVINRYF